MWYLCYIEQVRDGHGYRDNAVAKSFPGISKTDISSIAEEVLKYTDELNPILVSHFDLEWVSIEVSATTLTEFVDRLKKNAGLQVPTTVNSLCPICQQPITRGQWQSEEVGLHKNKPAHSKCCAIGLVENISRNHVPSDKP